MRKATTQVNVLPVVYRDEDVVGMIRDHGLYAGRQVMGAMAEVRDPILLLNTFRFDDKYEERFRALFDRSPDAYLLVAEGKITTCNEATLKDGEFFGEVALVKGQPRNASIRAVGYCDLYALRMDTFDHVIAHHPGFKEHIDRMVTERFTRS